MTDPAKDVDQYSGIETTGHEWDGIKELNNPLPRWWLYIFYATVLWAIVYMVLMPALPALPGMGGGNTPGLRNHSDRDLVAQDLAALQQARSADGARLLAASLQEIEDDRNLLQFALAAGESAFGDNCATCHGAGGRGANGYPSLADDVWLWDGTLDGIEYTLRHGIRHPGDDETRFSLMPAYGADGLMSRSDIDDLAEYVLHISGRAADQEAVGRASNIWTMQCAACHGVDGAGDRTQGAPNLTDQEWLFGGDRADIRDSIFYARNAHMPAWQDRLDDQTIKALSVYVHSLGGGE
ncbi:MAG: cytochrome-c oxidase, cbb3-type subunit III [Pseudomonadota bacterium]